MKLRAYRWFMKLAHRHGWHHVTRTEMANGDVHNWCQWCGMKEVLERGKFWGMAVKISERCPSNQILITDLRAFEQPDRRILGGSPMGRYRNTICERGLQA